jgi:hypothetical protein
MHLPFVPCNFFRQVNWIFGFTDIGTVAFFLFVHGVFPPFPPILPSLISDQPEAFYGGLMHAFPWISGF